MAKEEKEFKIAKSTTAQVFDKMLKTSSPLGDEFICLSSYAVGQTIGDQIIPTSEQLKGYKKTQLGMLSDSLARKATKSQLISGKEFILEGKTYTVDKNLAKSYFGLKDLTSQLKKIMVLQEICDLQERKGEEYFTDELRTLLGGLAIKDSAEIRARQEKLYEKSQKQLAEIKQAHVKVEEKIVEEKESLEKVKEELAQEQIEIQHQKYYEELAHEFELMKSPKILTIKKRFEKEHASEDKKIKEKAKLNAVGALTSLLPKSWELAKIGVKRSGEAWDEFREKIPKEKRLHLIDYQKIYTQLNALTKSDPTPAAIRKFFSDFIPEESDFASDVREAIQSPHTGIKKIVEGKDTLKVKKAKLESVSSVIDDLREKMQLGEIKEPAVIKGKMSKKKVESYGSSLKKMVTQPDFNVLIIPEPTMVSLIQKEYEEFQKAK